MAASLTRAAAVTAFGLAGALALAPGAAGAPLPVTNGPIVFEAPLFTRPGVAVGIANADGSNAKFDLIGAPPSDRDPAPSPDGTRLAFTSLRDGNEEIYVAALDGSGQRNLTQSPARDHDPDWGPGDRIAFTSDRAGGEHVFIAPAAGGPATQLTSGPGGDEQPS